MSVSGFKDIPDPVFIGGTGGSGTRVVAMIARWAGYFMGSELNVSNDSISMVQFYKKWLPIYMKRQTKPLDKGQVDSMGNDFIQSIVKHRDGISAENRPWGVKNPPSMLLLPFLHEVFDQMRFIQIIRDGRDMAFSRNKSQISYCGKDYLEEDYSDENIHVQQMAYWAKSNFEAYDFAESNLGKRYLLVRFEDVCFEPEKTCIKMSDFLESENPRLDEAVKKIHVPETIGRWKRRDPELVKRLVGLARDELEFFGYGD